jgi:hypothetical protein
MSPLEHPGARLLSLAMVCAVVAGAHCPANAVDTDGIPDWYEVVLDLDRESQHIDPRMAAQLIAFAEIGRDRCGFSPFPTWSLFKLYHLQPLDYRVTVASIGERSGAPIGPYFQFMLDAEDEATRLFAIRGQEEGCRIVRDEVTKHVKLDD